MADVKERYAEVTRLAKQEMKARTGSTRSAEVERVFKAFRNQAKGAFKTLRSGSPNRAS